MELVDIPLNYFLAGFAAWVVGFLYLAKNPEWIAAILLAIFFFFGALVDTFLGGRLPPTGQIILLFFFPPLFVSIVLRPVRLVWTDLILIGGYMFCIVISIIMNDRSLWGNKGALLPLLFMALVYLSIDSPKALYRVLFVYVVLLVSNTVFAALQIAGYDWAYLADKVGKAEAGGFRRGFGLLGNFTHASLYATITIPIAAAMFIRSHNSLLRVLSFGVGVLGVSAQIFSVSRSAVLGIAMGMWVVLKRGFDLRAVAVGIIALGVAAIILVSHSLTRESAENLLTHLSVFVSEDTELDSSAANRPEFARMGLRTWSENRIFGGGPLAVHRDYGRDPHNTFISVLAQYGIVGLMFFLLILYRCYRATVRAGRMGYLAEGAGLGGALVATLPIAFFHSLERSDLFWFVPALCMALERFQPVSQAANGSIVAHPAPPATLR